MVKRKIVWKVKANQERKAILEYWIKRNKSKSYSIKLNQLFIETTKQIAEHPTIGRKTEYKNVRVKVIRDYLLFYEYDKIQLQVLAIWDSRRDKTELKINNEL